MTTPRLCTCGTCHGILKLLSALQPLTEEEKRVLLERSRKSMEESTRRMQDRLLRMQTQTELIQ